MAFLGSLVATHSPHNREFQVKWNFQNFIPRSEDRIELYRKDDVGFSYSVSNTWNREAVVKGSCDLKCYTEEMNSPELQYTVCYRSNGSILISADAITISREDESASMPGKLFVECNATDKYFLVNFDFSLDLSFLPSDTDCLYVSEVPISYVHYILSSSGTSERTGRTYIPFSRELSRDKIYVLSYVQNNRVIAVSPPFQCQDLDDTDLSNSCQLTAHFDATTCTVVETSWSFAKDLKIKLSTTQAIKLYHNGEEDLSQYHQVSVLVSGKHQGHMRIHLKGSVENGKTYLLRYVNNKPPDFCFGSISFEVRGISEDDSHISHFLPSQLENANIQLQYITEATLARSPQHTNPLLTIAIDTDFSLSDFATQQLAQSSSALSSRPPSAITFPILDDYELQNELFIQMDSAPVVIYAGAGCSMEAPSCSPSWWRLMADLLRCTFDAVPDEHRPVNVSDSDISRQPEEIMESYYYILREKLLTLFQLLEEGRPNANHVAIAKLAKIGKVQAIFTTNFDIFIERALRENNVPFETIVTQEEFMVYKDRLLNGTAPLAVLKIHGTVERPDTIVAVANHYKMGKGFGLAKADVLQDLVRDYPVLF